MNFLESMNIELKEILTSELKKEVVAFANTCDGTIYIGINDKIKKTGANYV
ncbi:MAG: helix-turn-helix domain-containing protein [Fusobacterium sp.]|uniref:AlbA family DNA-binding domain-containing protein n=1 Tax=uncultured Fusobacterium sp. TaxID=159267 RepID=UPI0025EB405C|nr:ATP-binding protein [uncultured Fusobacterium sp.]